jgi:hypothetical protein
LIALIGTAEAVPYPKPTSQNQPTSACPNQALKISFSKTALKTASR